MSNLFLMSLFYSSFTPLWVSILIKDCFSLQNNSKDKNVILINMAIIFILFIVSFIVICISLSTNDKKRFTEYTIISAKEEKNLTVEFLLSYILPLFAFDFGTKEGLILFTVFFLTIGFLCFRHDNFITSIILELLGYRFYSCEIEQELAGGKVSIKKKVMSNKDLTLCLNEKVRLCPINDEYKFEKDIQKLK